MGDNRGEVDTGEDDEVLDLTADDELDDNEGADEADDEAEGDDDQQGGADDEGEDDGETVIGFEDELGDDPERDRPEDTSIIKKMRQELRESRQRIRELETSNKPAPVQLRDKPTLQDHNFDEDAFEADLLKWQNEKRDADAEATKAQERDQRIQQDWQRDVSAYQAKKAALGVPDYADAEAAVESALSVVQQTVVVKAANDPAALIYALGKSETRLADLAKIEDPVKLAAAVARMEGSVKVTKRKKPPELDRPARGSARTVTSGDAELERLTKEADKTGDRTKLIAYKAQKKGGKGGK